MAGRVAAQSPAPAWLSAISLGQRDGSTTTLGSNTSVVMATAPDGQGNLYVTGYFVGAVPFGATTLVSTPYSAGSTNYTSDIFVAKWSVSGSRYLWAASAGGPGSEGASQLNAAGTAQLSLPDSFAPGYTWCAPGRSLCACCFNRKRRR